jgi:hypothetical protein
MSILTLLAQKKPLGGEITPQAGGYKTGLTTGLESANVFEKLISNALAAITIVGGLMFVLYFLLGALNWTTSGGDKAKIDKAKSMMTNAAIGLIIILLSYSIAYIVGAVLGIKILEPMEMLSTTIKF